MNQKSLNKLLCTFLAVIFILSTPAAAYAAEASDTAGSDTTSSVSAGSDTSAGSTTTVSAPAEFRAVWFSFRDWQSLLKGKSEADFKAAFSTVCKNTVDNKLNAIIVHVRSHNDAVYPSSIYPWSTEMLGGNPGYDPLSIIVETAHAYGLQVHAWINPYGYRGGKYCGDASLATHDNIISGVREILSGYAVDGIHFDDYFPPLGASVQNALLKDVYNTAHAYGKVFGISPGGNIDNNIAAGIDVGTWLGNKGYADYICPQIYWTNDYGKSGGTTMYNDRLAAWRALDTAGIPMYIGLGVYLAGTSPKSDKGWGRRSDNLSTQVTALRNAGCAGYILFSYSGMTGKNAATEMKNLRAIN